MKKCLVIGYGSIGKRHADILSLLGHEVILVTLQSPDHFPFYSSIQKAFSKNSFDYVVIANPTGLHFETLCELIQCDFKGIILVEKPLYVVPQKLPTAEGIQIYVAYNLRFSESLLLLKKLIANDELISFSANVGQYLPQWRKDRDYRESYSAKKELGGGVLADLSHELDYTTWICGKSLEVASRGGYFSDLEINSDDVYSILMRCENCPIVNIQLNYLDRVKRRDILIHTKKHSISIDLVQGSLKRDDDLLITNDAMSDTYIRQHQAIIKNDFSHLCSYESGLSIVNLMQKISEANVEKKWIEA